VHKISLLYVDYIRENSFSSATVYNKNLPFASLSYLQEKFNENLEVLRSFQCITDFFFYGYFQKA